MPTFDYKAARQSGYNDQEIASFLDEEKRKGNDLYIPKSEFESIEKEPGFFQKTAQAIVKPALRGFANIIGLGEAIGAGLQGDIEGVGRAVDPERERSFGFLGKAKPVTTPKDVFTVGAELGATIAPVGKAIPILKGAVMQGLKVGGASGGIIGAAQAIEEGQAPTDIASSAAIGATFGAAGAAVLSGIGQQIIKAVTRPSLSEITHTYRNALNVHKPDIRRIETVGKKELDDSLQFLLEEEIIPTKTKAGTIDVKSGIKILIDRKKEVDQLLESALDNSLKRNDLSFVKGVVENSLRKTVKNASELDDMLKNVDTLIEKEIERNGRFVTDKTLHKIKNGMWSIGFDTNNRTKSPVGRRIGFAAKEMIQNNTSDVDIKQMNQLSATYKNGIDLLEGVHGNVVKGGRVGNWFNQVIGGFVFDRVLGSIPGVKTVALPLGAYIGKHYNEFINDPERIAKEALKELRKIKLTPRSEKILDDFEKNIPILKGKQFLDEMRSKFPSVPLLPSGVAPKGHFERSLIELEGKGILEGQSKLRGFPKEPRSFQESSGVQPVYPPVRSENRMLTAGKPGQSLLNQGRAIRVLPNKTPIEFIGKDIGIGKFTPKKKGLKSK